MDKSFSAIGEKLIIEVDNIFDTKYFNDVCLMIGLEAISKTNIIVNVSVPLLPTGILYNGNDSFFEGEAYRSGTQIIIIIRSASFNIISLKVKGILYK